MKKIAAVVLCLIIIFSFSGCGKKSVVESPSSEDIQAYAKLLITKGCNIQKGQKLYIQACVEDAEFARLCAAEAYKLGCSEVCVNWVDYDLLRLKYLYADDEVFDTVNSWDVSAKDTLAKGGAALLNVCGENVKALEGVDLDRIIRYSAAQSVALRDVLDIMVTCSTQWCAATLPNQNWAELMYPDLSPEDAYNTLWQNVLYTARVDGENTLKNWDEQSEFLSSRANRLNSYNFKTLVFKNSLGTDFSIDLAAKHYWSGGGETTPAGVNFIPNFPTEEVCTVPNRNSANGVVYASMPLVLNGQLVEGIRFEFKNGEVVDIHADTNEDLLRNVIATDEGSRFLGEVALVPADSPISNLGVLFYDALFDENASCHLALGDSYTMVYDAAELDENIRRERGLNQSDVHIDFMFGTKDLSIVGITQDGREVVVFKDGNPTF